MDNNELILDRIEALITGYQYKYVERPNYIKMPIWVYKKLKDLTQELLTNFNYKELEEKEKDFFMIYGLKVCPTISIKSLGEMEVF